MHQSATHERVGSHRVLSLYGSFSSKRDQATGSILERPSDVVAQTEPAPVCDMLRHRLGHSFFISAHEVEVRILSGHGPPSIQASGYIEEYSRRR
jgi:hypothetical protein